MNVLYLLLYFLAAACFLVSVPVMATTAGKRAWNLMALGLFFWVSVALIHQIVAMSK